MKLISMLKSEGYQVSLQDLLAHPTVFGLSSIVTMTTSPTETVVKLLTQPDKQYEPFPLNDIQFAYWIGRKVRNSS
jgi:yersiniabactin nonribosomal peptide synthetase